MITKILEEHGHESALLGLSLSFYDHKIPIEEWWTEEKKEKAAKRLRKLAFMQGGHNKALESIVVWGYIQASRSFWQEFDTYRTGMTKNSSSTMHTLDKRFVEDFDFEIGTSEKAIAEFNNCLFEYKDPTNFFYKDVTRLKDNLPEGWLQERQFCTNYKTIQNIYFQRKKHRLRYWKEFTESLVSQLEHPEYIIPANVKPKEVLVKEIENTKFSELSEDELNSIYAIIGK